MHTDASVVRQTSQSNSKWRRAVLLRSTRGLRKGKRDNGGRRE